MKRFKLVLAFMAFAGGALAEPGDEPIPPEAWRAMTAGKTVHYYQDGKLFGREYYLNEQGDVVFRFPNGVCAEGRWAYADQKYCFAFDAEVYCFRHVKRGDQIVIIAEEDGDEQVVERIVEKEPLSCDSALDS